MPADPYDEYEGESIEDVLGLPKAIREARKRTRRIPSVETELSLPAFTVDPGYGYVLFRDESLGGCGIFEVTPHVTTMGITGADEYLLADRPHDPQYGEKDYEPSMGRYYALTRRYALPQWMHLLNALAPSDDGVDDAIHIQIMLMRSVSEYTNMTEYVGARTQQDIMGNLESALDDGGLHVGLAARGYDYLDLLADVSDNMGRQITSLHATPHPSQVKQYLVVSYTPSFEGWWTDGHDSDYYVSEDDVPLSAFKTDDMADRIISLIARVSGREHFEDDGMDEWESDIIPIQSKLTVDTIRTRMRRIEAAEGEWERDHTPAFTLRPLEQWETTALLRFFDDPFSPYVGKVRDLRPDTRQVQRDLRIEHALSTENPMLVDDLSQTMSDDDVERFLASIRGAEERPKRMSDADRILKEYQSKSISTGHSSELRDAGDVARRRRR